ncbi:EAL domain-containing protein [Rhodococcus sp. IEGM 1401]|uniref:sensor domain-containing phosphodiesterase n=1 Tax=unclassified Rhodococcus (in: high G+C Gram-positive bacteria) TaxID=192944 RepID=UPI0022B4AB5F|nr:MULTISPECIES: EAL domain-containing protein [unclassified Rhodococcus (in: high G+C Gram-positive bacteria)]MCZ4560866.1 EAL domain-containing protein [Rhodococcus sp. IEGM 1401]MDI9921006.1 EAL domain-containing protein [Rhodococcus sp. IEGM 1372]MDV8033393.1 EAL domain-containing protein [Rhodococcus sp. IEGM 1414]
MFRSTARRQSDSARKYLDFSALTPALDAAAQLTAAALDFPISMINIVDKDTQYTLAQHGFAPSAGAVVPRAHTICAHTVDANRIVGVDDVNTPGASTLPDDSSVREMMLDAGLSAYAGIPIVGREGMVIGTLCVFDTEPHPVTETHERLLTLLAGTVQEQLSTHRDRGHSPLDSAGSAEFAAAISAGEISPWYQPIIDLDSGRVAAVEALARWNHPSRGLLTPDAFIERIEASELIIDLDLAILTAGLRDLVTWLPIDNSLRVHINLSGVHFAHPDCVDRLITTVRDSGCNPKSVVLEITESASFASSPVNTRFVADLRDAGFGVVLDDLGAAWSGLERLLEFPLSGFKVDKAVTERLGTRAGDAMMRTLHSLAQDLELEFTVEGVETAEQAGAVAALGSVHGQGYWWSRPVPAADIVTLLSKSVTPVRDRTENAFTAGEA